MNKYIEKVEQYKQKTLECALKKLGTEYKEAKDSYADFGYDRYFKKMQKCEEQITEIKKYLNAGMAEDLGATEYKELLMLRQAIKNIKSKVFYLSQELPACTDLVGLQDLLKDF